MIWRCALEQVYLWLLIGVGFGVAGYGTYRVWRWTRAGPSGSVTTRDVTAYSLVLVTIFFTGVFTDFMFLSSCFVLE